MSIGSAQFASPYSQAPATLAQGRFSASKQAEIPSEEELQAIQGQEGASQPPAAPADPAAEAAAKIAAQNQQLYAGLKSDLEAMGPVGGSRSYRTKANGDVVILNNQRTIIPQTGIKTVDSVSKEITPTVDTTTSVVGNVISSITRGITYGGIVGGILGFMLKIWSYAPSRQFKKLGLTTAGFAMAGAMLGASLQGIRAMIDGARKVTQSVNNLVRGNLKPHRKQT